MEIRTVTGAQFLWLVLQHNCKRLIALLHAPLKFQLNQGFASLVTQESAGGGNYNKRSDP